MPFADGGVSVPFSDELQSSLDANSRSNTMTPVKRNSVSQYINERWDFDS